MDAGPHRIPVAGGRMHAVAEDKAIQVAIEIVVEKGGLGAESRQVETVLGGPFGEAEAACHSAVVDEQLVFALELLVITHLAHVNIEPAVAVHIGDGDARFPAAGAAHAGRRGEVCEPAAAAVEVEFVLAGVRGKVQIRQTIVIQVAGCHAAAIVVIEVLNDVHAIRRLIGQDVRKINAGRRRR